MKELLIFAGTTEGRNLSEYLSAAGVSHTVCVATEYGEITLPANPLATVHRGRMGAEDIKKFVERGNFAAIVDATHPYAKEITSNIKKAVQSIPVLRLKREYSEESGEFSGHIVYFDTAEACAEALEYTEGNILLTTGSKELSKYCGSESVRNRLYVRVLPSMESLSLCMEQGICGKQIIAMQGPFTAEMNAAVLRQYEISHLVTKESGRPGGYGEKLEAAQKTGTQVFVIGREEEEGGLSFCQVCDELEKITGRKLREKIQMEIVLAGVGMGYGKGLTKEAEKEIAQADILLGAKRLLEGFHPKIEKKAYYLAEQIIPYLEEMQEKNLCMKKIKTVILFSGDSGFYSGCQSLYKTLKKEVEEKRLTAGIRILPGISSVAYLASCIGESYQDADIYSLHGREVYNLSHRIRNRRKTFLLMSGVRDVNRLGELLTEAGMTECEITTGYQLSYEDQRIEKYTPQECCRLSKEGLYTCFIKNPHAVNRILTHGIADECFIRDKVPMTKEEVREVSICKLRLHEGAVVYDIGSGTGSVAVEIAAFSDDIHVYAVEKKKGAAALIEKNKKKFGLENITVTKSTAPEGLSALPAATHAFIGGSGGKLQEILRKLAGINPGMRIVINAVSIETICEIQRFLPEFGIEGAEMVQIQANRVRKAGNYHLMQSENPVWICAFNLQNRYLQNGGTDED